jgi:hypothetical protein
MMGMTMMGNEIDTSTTRTVKMLHADDIRWTLEPIDRVEDIDWLGLTESETWEHLKNLQAEMRALRLTLSVALDHIAKLTRQLQRATRTIAAQRDQIRELLRERPAA